jgi:RNA polymerase sigma-70 factor, ECF subfamily
MSQPVDAMTTSPVPLSAEVLERFRAYLALLARLQVAPGLTLSGVVQQTLLEAFQETRRAPRERTEGETAAWLRSILGHNLADGLRKLEARKRDVRRDRSLTTALDESASRLGDWLATQESSPSQKLIRQ